MRSYVYVFFTALVSFSYNLDAMLVPSRLSRQVSLKRTPQQRLYRIFPRPVTNGALNPTAISTVEEIEEGGLSPWKEASFWQRLLRRPAVLKDKYTVTAMENIRNHRILQEIDKERKALEHKLQEQDNIFAKQPISWSRFYINAKDQEEIRRFLRSSNPEQRSYGKNLDEYSNANKRYKQEYDKLVVGLSDKEDAFKFGTSPEEIAKIKVVVRKKDLEE